MTPGAFERMPVDGESRAVTIDAKLDALALKCLDNLVYLVVHLGFLPPCPHSVQR